MALDLTTLRWKHLGGSSRIEPAVGMPGLRQHAASWVIEEHDKLYVMFGGANRTVAHLDGLPGSDPTDHTYNDFWSYSFTEKEWRQESILGNTPSRRTEHAAVFNSHLNRTVIYGGYSPGAPLHVHSNAGKQPDMFGFSYYSDAFVWNPEINQWRRFSLGASPPIVST